MLSQLFRIRSVGIINSLRTHLPLIYHSSHFSTIATTKMTADVAQNSNFRGGSSTVVGLLACQQNSYLKTLTTTVVGSRKYVPQPAVSAGDDKKKKKKGAAVAAAAAPVKQLYEIELEDTVLFPEGGGQPGDSGVLITEDGSEIKVTDVRRDGLIARHLVETELEKGTKVTAHIDWKRRLDLMQQHTGQHLLSAVIDKLGVETVGWNLGAQFNYVELDRKLSPEEVDSVQEQVSTAIQSSIPIEIEIPEEDVDHHAPEDYDTEKGVIRVVRIGDLDVNPCCGTHLRTTADINALALYYQQSNKGTNSRLFFMAGGRVTTYARSANDSVRRVNAALSCQTEEIDEKIARLNLQLRDALNNEKYWAGVTAVHEACSIKQQLEDPKQKGVVFLHAPKGTQDYFKVLEKELGDLQGGTVVLAGGAFKESGLIIVSGKDVAEVAKRVISKVSNVKGGGKGKWQGKVPVWEKGSLEALEEEFRA